MAEYIRPGKTVGIIGGGAFAFLLAMEAKILGFRVCVLESTKECPAGKMADEFIEGNIQDLYDLEQLGRRCDVLLYATNRLQLHTMMTIEEKFNLPQGINGLAYAQDLFLKKTFLEDVGINIAPYATIVRITDIEENIDGIGYPCLLRDSQGVQEVVIESASDVVQAMELVKQDSCILESMIAYQYDVSMAVARNNRGDVMFFPPVEHVSSFGEERKFQTKDDLDPLMVQELERIARVIVEKMEYEGTMTIRYHITSEGVIYVDDMVSYPDESTLLTLDACQFNTFSAHLRGVCQWPLQEKADCFMPAVTTLITGKDISSAKRQIEHQANWHFYFYDYEFARGDSVVGHVTALTSEQSHELLEMDKFFL